MNARDLENKACALVVGLGGGPSCRRAVARALRAWRRENDFNRARWFRRHAFYISGHLYK